MPPVLLRVVKRRHKSFCRGKREREKKKKNRKSYLDIPHEAPVLKVLKLQRSGKRARTYMRTLYCIPLIIPFLACGP